MLYVGLIMAYVVYLTDGRFVVLTALLTFQIFWDVTPYRLVLAELTSQNTLICFGGICDMAYVPRNAKKMFVLTSGPKPVTVCPWIEFLRALRLIHLYLQWMHVKISVCHHLVGSIAVSYSWSSGFESWSGDQLTYLEVSRESFVTLDSCNNSRNFLK